MKSIPVALQAHLDSGATTLCWCWRLTRRDGLRQGFTDHDRDLTFDGTVFEAMSGFTASEVKDSVGLSVDNLELSGAVSSASLNDTDLAAGRYDDAGVEIFRVNWANSDQRVLMRSGSLGEVRRAGSGFSAEIRGLAHYLQQPKGRLFQYGCDADVGDGRCGVILSDPAFSGAGQVVLVHSVRKFEVSGLAAFAAGLFQRGLLQWTSGLNSGRAIEVKQHVVDAAGTVLLELWQPMAQTLSVGDGFTVTAGCDKQFATCTTKFANGINFRGFPHMPGNDFITGRVSRDGTNDGQPR